MCKKLHIDISKFENARTTKNKNRDIKKSIIILINDLENCNDENKIKTKLSELRELNNKFSQITESNEEKKIVNTMVQKAINSTVLNIEFSLKSGQQCEITIFSKKDNKRIWKFVFKTNYRQIKPVFGMTFDQLHDDNFGVGIYISVLINVSENPFKKKIILIKIE